MKMMKKMKEMKEMKEMTIKLRVLIALVAMTLPFPGMADVQPAALFADGMVIQRETKAPVWGTADAGARVTITASWGETAATTADTSGKWSVKLKTPKAGGPYTLTIQGNNTVEIKDVLAGEVWFCSGQSNMDFVLAKFATCNDGLTDPADRPAAEYIKNEIATAEDGLLRQFTVQKNTSPFEPVAAFAGSWMKSSPEANASFSATAYFFGRELRRQLGVPVALIKCAWGATYVESWMPAEALQNDAEMAAYYQSHAAGLKSKLATWDPATAEARYQAALKKWEATKKGRKPRPAGNPKAQANFPSTLFNAMVNPVIPYAIKGVIWYQGEGNSERNTEKYEHNFRTMISAWRKHWGQGDFPFYFAQLANLRAPVSEPADSDSWASVCDQQRRTLGLNNTGMAVLSDIGEANDVHPHNKMDVGKRLALWALKHDYPSTELRAGKKAGDLVCSGPLYKSHNIKGDQVIIQFDSAGSGLMSGEKSEMEATHETKAPLKYFQICGADRQWKWAQAEIIGKDKVTVSHPEVPKPVAVRYAWSMNAKSANLYNKEGLPASIFTTEAEIPAPAGAVSPGFRDSNQERTP